MARAQDSPLPKVCGHCVWGDHYICRWEGCACSRQDHDPDDEVAMTMAVVLTTNYPWCKKNPEEAAALWRERTMGKKQPKVEASEWKIMPEGKQDRRRKIPEGHREVSYSTGPHNPKNPKDWCYKIRCECGYEDLAWSYEDAVEQVAEHRREVLAKPRRRRVSDTPPRDTEVKKATSPKSKPKKPVRMVY